MWTNKVIWSEGMFLQPQHLQQQDRHLEAWIEARSGPLAAHHWGFVTLAIDEPQLALGKVGLAAARGILPDGTPFDFPAADAGPEPLDIPPDARDLLVLLALPARRAGGQEADLDGESTSGLERYAVREFSVGDSTAPEHAALVQVGRLRLRLILATEATDAYTCVGVVRVTERRSDHQVILDKGYIPPALAVRENPVLASYARELHGLLHQRGDALAATLGQPGRGGIAEIADFLFLQTVNRFEPLFAHLVEATLLHPERLYAACLALAGDLAIFARDSRRPIDFPGYRHDDLEATFRPLVGELRRNLSITIERAATPIDLQERRHNVRVAIVPDRELFRSAGFVLAVNANVPSEVLRTRFPPQVKIGPAEKIRDLVNLQLAGIRLNPLAVAPRQIPYHAGFTYFELERGGELWAQLEQSSALAMHVAGDFPGLVLELWAIRG
jgi:type VI secretion system protein ImpJ